MPAATNHDRVSRWETSLRLQAVGSLIHESGKMFQSQHSSLYKKDEDDQETKAFRFTVESLKCCAIRGPEALISISGEGLSTSVL